MSEAPTFTIRPACYADEAFISHSWLHSYAGTGFKQSSSSVYWDHHPALVKRALARSRVDVACLPDDEESILGWIVYQLPQFEEGFSTVQYVYVKHPFRRFGIAKKLLEIIPNQERVIYTQRTPVLESMSIPSSWVFNPYLFYGA